MPITKCRCFELKFSRDVICNVQDRPKLASFQYHLGKIQSNLVFVVIIIVSFRMQIAQGIESNALFNLNYSPGF